MFLILTARHGIGTVIHVIKKLKQEYGYSKVPIYKRETLIRLLI